MNRPKRNFDNYGYQRNKEVPQDGSDRLIRTPLGEIRILCFKY